jgi:peroxin-19
MSDLDLDSLLDNALDEFDREEKTQAAQQLPSTASQAELPDEYAQFKSFMEKLAPALAEGVSDEALNGLMAEAMSKVRLEEESSPAVVMHTADTTPTPTTTTSPPTDIAAATVATATATTTEGESEAKTSEPKGFNSGVEQAVKELSVASVKKTATDPMAEMMKGLPADAGLEDMLKNVLASFGSEEGAPELDKMMESIVGEMFSKENLEGPLKEIVAKYPPWLEKNKSKLSATDLKNYQNQLDCFHRMLASLETGKPSAHMTDLLNEMQNYGQPPEEITGAAGNPFAGPNPFAGGPGLPPLTPEEQEAMKKMANECPTM